MRLKFRYLTVATVIIGCFHFCWSILFTQSKYNGVFKTIQLTFGTKDTNVTNEIDWIQRYYNSSYNCTNNEIKDTNRTEDILCMKKPVFLQNYKNPCWYDGSQKLRCLPYFYIFGVCKSGTTDLCKRMLIHPQIVQNEGLFNKETWFWSWKRYGTASDNGRHQTLSDFIDLFPLTNDMKYDTELQQLYSSSVTGHGDPMDIWFPFDWREIPQNDPNLREPVYITPHLIKYINPNIRLIVILRDPADRLYSHYIQYNRYGKACSAEDFHNKVKVSIDIFDECQRQNGTRACAYNWNTFEQMKVSLTTGLYSVFLKDWLDVFGKDQIFIIRTEDYSNNIAATLLSLFKFLDIDDVDLKTLRRMSCKDKAHKTDYKVITGKMQQRTRNILNTFYNKNQVDIQTVFQKYGIDMRTQQLNIPQNQMNCSGLKREVTVCKPCVSKCNYNNPLQEKNIIRYKVHKINKRDFVSIKNE